MENLMKWKGEWVKEKGFCYGGYDENMVLQPITSIYLTKLVR